MLLHVKKPAAFVLLLTMTACTSLQPVAEPGGFVAEKSPSFVVITTVDQDQDPIVVARPQMDGGNLVGMTEGERASIPIVSIRTVRAVQPDRKKTMFAVLGGALATGVVTYLLFNTGSRIDRSPVCVPEGHRGDLPYCD